MDHVETQPRWLTPAEAARYLGVCKNFLDKDRLSRLHGIPFARLGKLIRYDARDLDIFLESRKENTEVTA